MFGADEIGLKIDHENINHPKVVYGILVARGGID